MWMIKSSKNQEAATATRGYENRDPNRVFFSKFLMGGTQNFRSPSVPDGDEVGWGGLVKKIPTEAKTAHLMQN